MEETLEIHLDFQQKMTLTEQIRRIIFELIELRKLKSGSLLPTVRQLASQLGVNFNTVARAYRALDAAGVITTRQGRGTYVIGMVGSTTDEKQGKTIPVKERVEQFLQETEKHGISRREIAEVMLALTLPERRREKIQVRFRTKKKKKDLDQAQSVDGKAASPLPRMKSVRVNRRKPGHAILFHVKQKRGQGR